MWQTPRPQLRLQTLSKFWAKFYTAQISGVRSTNFGRSINDLQASIADMAVGNPGQMAGLGHCHAHACKHSRQLGKPAPFFVAPHSRIAVNPAAPYADEAPVALLAPGPARRRRLEWACTARTTLHPSARCSTTSAKTVGAVSGNTRGACFTPSPARC